MEKLYVIAEEYKAFEELCYAEDIDPQIMKDTLEAIFGEFEEKSDNLAKIHMEIQSSIKAIEVEMDRLNARAKQLEGKDRWIKEYLMENMRYTGKEKFKTALFSYSICKNGGAEPLVIDGTVEDIPPKYTIPQPPVVNKEAVRQLLSEKQVDWAHFEPRGEHLRIR